MQKIANNYLYDLDKAKDIYMEQLEAIRDMCNMYAQNASDEDNTVSAEVWKSTYEEVADYLKKFEAQYFDVTGFIEDTETD